MEEWEERKEETREQNTFLKGLFCGVLLSLACLAFFTVFLQWRIHRRIETLTQSDAQESVDAQESTGAQKSADAQEQKQQRLALDGGRISDKLTEIEEMINLYYDGPIQTDEVEEEIYAGLIAGLQDPYSEYYSADALARMEETSSGAYCGIGAVLQQNPDTGEVAVVTCFPGTPALEAGMQPGDIILAVNAVDMSGMPLDELVSRIRTDAGETVLLKLLREDGEIELSVSRRDIQVPTVQSRMLEAQIGYLQILEFDEVTPGQFTEALQDLQEQGMEKLIVDVRDNPGGVLQAVCDVLDELLPPGLIVYMEDKNGERTEYRSDGEHRFAGPLAVLVNENSASAAEIFAGAIKDYELGPLVGTTTYGKGVVQRIFHLLDGTGVKLTIARYYTPQGTDIHEKGIEPDVETPYEKGTTDASAGEPSGDAQLQQAIRILQKDGEGS